MKAFLISIFLIFISQTISIEEIRIDMRKYSADKEATTAIRDLQLNHKFNLALPYTDEWWSLMK